ncbi:hypothetical protein GOP47_0030856 [Adiantum capillus-veneris]|nr:hypothetical protein GOP47_0030856 [Adiantum capillus-veneris]
MLKALLIKKFAHENITQTTLQQLTALKQQRLELVAQFAVRLNQLLLRVDPMMSEQMKLFFRLRHDLSRQVRNQGPTSFHSAILIAQWIEGSNQPDTTALLPSQPRPQHLVMDSNPAVSMDIDVQNA